MSSSPAPDYKHDPRYRRYASAIEKNLQTFEAINEWPDFISFLSRLTKTISSYPQFPSLPKKLLVSKRLAQCLNPALPGGVHQKTIEAYDMIFNKIGPDALAQDLSVYSVGLFPFFEHAKTMTRSDMIRLVEQHLVPLGTRLHSSLQSLMLSLLPGLEEDTGEFFPAMIILMNKIRASVGKENFYQSLWSCLLISNRHRLAIVNYILKELPSKVSSKDFKVIFGENESLVVAALGAGIEDKNSLVVRGILDIILLHFPIRNEDSTLPFELHSKLMGKSLHIVLRKDMSLTRRLYSWLRLNETATTPESSNNLKKAFSVLVDALKNMLEKMELDLRVLKIMIILMDKVAIADGIVEDILLPSITAVKRLVEDHPEQKEKILGTANGFFDIVDLTKSWFIMSQKFIQITMHESEAKVKSELLNTLTFTITNLSLCDEEAIGMHVPIFYICVLLVFKELLANDKILAETNILLETSSFARAIFDKIGADPILEGDSSLSETVALGKISKISIHDIQDSKLTVSLTKYQNFQDFSAISLTKTLYLCQNLEILTSIGKAIVGKYRSDAEENLEMLSKILYQTTFLIEKSALIFADSKNSGGTDCEAILAKCFDFLKVWLDLLAEKLKTIRNIDIILIITAHLLNMQPLMSFESDNFVVLNADALEFVTDKIWESLSVTNIAACANIMCELVNFAPPIIDHFVAKQLLHLEFEVKDRVQNIRRFALLWERLVVRDDFYYGGMSKCLFALIDMTYDTCLEIQKAAINWFTHSLCRPAAVMDILLSVMLESLVALEDEVLFEGMSVFTKPFDIAQVNYAVSNILKLLTLDERSFAQFLSSFVINGALLKIAEINIPSRFRTIGLQSVDITYRSLLLSSIISYAFSEVNSTFDMTFQNTFISIQSQSLKILNALTSSTPLNFEELLMIRKFIVSKLYLYVEKRQFAKASKFLEVLQVCLQKIYYLRNDGILPMTSASTALVGDSTNQIGKYVGAASSFAGIIKTDSPLTAFEDIDMLCLNAIVSGDSCYVIQEWLDFVLATLLVQQNASDELLVGIVKVLLTRISVFTASSASNADGKSADATLTYEKTEAFLCQLLSSLFQILYGSISKMAFVKSAATSSTASNVAGSIASTLSSVSGKNFRSVFSGHSSSEKLSPIPSSGASMVPDSKAPSVLRLLPKIILDLLKLHVALTSRVYMQSSGEEQYLLKPAKMIIDGLFNLHNTQPDVVLTACVETQVIGNEENIPLEQSFLFDLEKGPFSKDFVKRMSNVYRNVSNSFRYDYTRVTSESIVEFMQDCTGRIRSEGILGEMWLFAGSVVRDVLTNNAKIKNTAAPSLRWIIALFHQQAALGYESRKLARDQYDSFIRLCELNIAYASKLNEFGYWVDYPHNLGIADCKISAKNDLKGEEQLIQYSRDKGAFKCLLTIYTHLLPVLTTFITDQDRQISLASQVISQLVSPNMRGAQKRHFCGILGIQSLLSMREPLYIVRIWRKDLWEAFYDPFFFQMPLVNLEIYVSLTRVALQTEPERFTEIAGKIPASGSATIFLSKEIENINRAMSIRRVAFACYCCDPELVRQHFPMLLEKIVDILKLPVGIAVAEVYFLVRVLLMVVPEENLMTLWPIVIMDLVQLFHLFLRSTPSALPKETIVAVYQACKLVDTMLLMASGTINFYSSAFVSSPTQEESPTGSSCNGLFEKICQKFDLSGGAGGSKAIDEESYKYRRPILKAKSAGGFQDFAPFFLLAKHHLDSDIILERPADMVAIHGIIRQDFVDGATNNEQ